MAVEFLWKLVSHKNISAIGRRAHRRMKAMSKIIITIVGQDRVGIVAKTCNYLADHNMNILDITQTILQEYFNMMMIVDISGSKTSFDDMAHELDKLGQEIGVKILCQREEIFTSMHRV